MLTTLANLIIITLVALPILRAAPPASCSDLEDRNPQSMLAYLQRDRGTLNPSCITYAIGRLGSQRYAPASYVLGTYLDFRIPGGDDDGHIIVVKRLPWLSDKYPAAGALFEIGKPASPSLVRLIGEPNTSDLMRDNASQVLLMIHREDMAEAIKLLNNASRSAPDSAASIRLWDAARKQAARCPGELRVRCEVALFEQNKQ